MIKDGQQSNWKGLQEGSETSDCVWFGDRVMTKKQEAELEVAY